MRPIQLLPRLLLALALAANGLAVPGLGSGKPDAVGRASGSGEIAHSAAGEDASDCHGADAAAAKATDGRHGQGSGEHGQGSLAADTAGMPCCADPGHAGSGCDCDCLHAGAAAIAGALPEEHVAPPRSEPGHRGHVPPIDGPRDSLLRPPIARA